MFPGIALMETSALDSSNINEAFKKLINGKIINKLIFFYYKLLLFFNLIFKYYCIVFCRGLYFCFENFY